MTEGALALLAAELGNQDCGAHPTRGVESLNGGMACYQLYRTRDGRYLSVGALEPKFWLAFATAIGRKPDLGDLAGDQVKLLAAHDCCVEPVLELDELADHPLHKQRAVFFSITAPDGTSIGQVRTPLGAPANPSMPPRLGEHTAAVLADYGFTATEIAALKGS
jgi:crotonobetainyl-CoA:carnitine CoA-transferase CaiB-like acyl-CoA transferase